MIEANMKIRGGGMDKFENRIFEGKKID